MNGNGNGKLNSQAMRAPGGHPAGLISGFGIPGDVGCGGCCSTTLAIGMHLG